MVRRDAHEASADAVESAGVGAWVKRAGRLCEAT